jgi:uncharacterized membrane protein
MQYDASIAVRYITALYWAISTMSTVGYGDVTAVSPVEKVMSCLQMLMGVAMFSYFMSSMAALGAMLNSSTARLAGAPPSPQNTDTFTHFGGK